MYWIWYISTGGILKGFESSPKEASKSNSRVLLYTGSVWLLSFLKSTGCAAGKIEYPQGM